MNPLDQQIQAPIHELEVHRIPRGHLVDGAHHPALGIQEQPKAPLQQMAGERALRSCR